MPGAVKGRRTKTAGRAFDKAKLVAELAKLYGDGVPQSEIAKRMSISQGYVSQLLTALKKRYELEAVEDVKRGKIRALETLDKVEARLWLAYEKSCLPRTVKRQQQTMTRDRAGALVPDSASDVILAVQTEDRPEGDARILAEIRRVAMDRARVLGVLRLKDDNVPRPNPDDPDAEPDDPGVRNLPPSTGDVLVIRVSAKAPPPLLEAKSASA